MNQRLFVGSDISTNGNLYSNVITCNELIINNDTAGFLFADLLTASGGLISNSDVTLNQRLFVSSALVTQGLVYETINTTTQSGTSPYNPSFSYGTGGVWTLATSPNGGNITLTVTNIPTDTTKSYTFSVVSYQATTRYYINSVVFTDTASASILSGAPLFNGGTPSLTGSTACVIIQQFTIISVGGARRVISSVSSCTT